MTTTAPSASAPLSGLRIVEISSFVAAPLCGLTLAQLGAEVIRVDPEGGAADVHRWPVTESGESIYWTGLNRGKQSVVLDLRSAAGRAAVRRLITAPGAGGGILVTNSAGSSALTHASLTGLRPDLISLQILGRHDGGAAVDYTVNAGVGFPSVTGPLDQGGVVNHVLPAWDIACGLYAALAVASAVRRRERDGAGAQISLALDDVALATAGTLGFLTEVQVNGRERPPVGNGIYGTFGNDFETRDGERFMVVALTSRHFDDLVRITGVVQAVDALEVALDADFTDESDRYEHRELLVALFSAWFRRHDSEEVAAALSASSVLHQRYRTFAQACSSPDVLDNPLFAKMDQPRIGTYLAPALPIIFDGAYLRVGVAPKLGSDTADVLDAYNVTTQVTM
ncbi:MAG: mesaconyl-CoA isomerase [Nocardia sp.]|uniref:CoA transferase n=1 Tax=Nocardia sp. TaxID=1821 RepID=UPI00261D4043|nr:CoA transferase [Nocardia sp.]MCU1642928.1 mesaconyl-CoA isomerase [Nocardia sp.]